MIKYFLIGSIGGLLSGILGIGGGVVFVPLLTYLTKTDFKTNTGVSSLAVVFVATVFYTLFKKFFSNCSKQGGGVSVFRKMFKRLKDWYCGASLICSALTRRILGEIIRLLTFCLNSGESRSIDMMRSGHKVQNLKVSCVSKFGQPAGAVTVQVKARQKSALSADSIISSCIAVECQCSA